MGVCFDESDHAFCTSYGTPEDDGDFAVTVVDKDANFEVTILLNREEALAVAADMIAYAVKAT